VLRFLNIINSYLTILKFTKYTWYNNVKNKQSHINSKMIICFLIGGVETNFLFKKFLWVIKLVSLLLKWIKCKLQNIF